MLRDLLSVFAVVAVATLVYRYHQRIADALRRFDARNVHRIAEQEAERADPLAHFRHTLRTAEEQVEAVGTIAVLDTRLGTPVTRYLFEGAQFATRDEAERVRAEKIRAIARGYYQDLPKALAERKAPQTVSPQKPPPPSTGSNVVPLRRNGETLH